MLSEDDVERIERMRRAAGLAAVGAQEALGKAFTEQHRQHLAKLGTLAASQLQDALGSKLLGEAIADAVKPKIQPFMPNAFETFGMNNAFKDLFEAQRQRIVELFEGMRQGLDASLPPNWRGGGIELPDNLETLVLDEGLPLAWVPPRDVLGRVVNADDAAGRRKIIGSSWKKITNACLVELDAVSAKQLVEYVEFARLAVDALLAGHHQASQALSANTLDTIIRREFDSSSRSTMTGRRTRLDIEEYPIRLGLVLGGIWGAHAEFWPQNGDKIPRNYSRHGSAHGVSRRQYSRINAVLALMHLVSLIRFIESEFREPRSN